MEGPKQDGSHKRLEHLDGNALLIQARIDLPALLACSYDAGDDSAALFHVVFNQAAHALAGQKAGDEGTGQVGTAARLLGGAMKQVAERRLNGLLAVLGQAGGFADLAELNLGHHAEDVFLALEVVEKCAFTHVGGLRDVFHSDVGEAALGKKLEGTTE